mgnify:CR=1 FL=1
MPASIHVSADGKIAAVHQHSSKIEAVALAKRLGVRFEPFDHEAISPGVVDAYAHLGAVLEGPGRSWEGYASGTQAAAAGGVTTVIDLPSQSQPPTTGVNALRRKAASARGKLHADIGFWGGIVPENADDPDTLLELLAQGALGLTAVVAVGMQPDAQVGSQRALGLSELEAAVATVAPANRPVLVHAEMVPPSEERDLLQRRQLAAASQHAQQQAQLGTAAGAVGGLVGTGGMIAGGMSGGMSGGVSGSSYASSYDGMDYMSWLEARPREWEERALRVLLALAAKQTQPPPRLHVLRFTDAASADALRAARRDLPDVLVEDGPGGAVQAHPRLTVSSSPHYLMFEAEGVVRGDTRLKCAPPLRDSQNRQQLWRALTEGTIDFLASDHTPATLEMRAGSFLEAFTGISGLQFTLPATWSEAAQHGATLSNLSKWLSAGPAKMAGLWATKGSISPGKDADLVIWRPEARADTASVYHRQPGSPYEDASLVGRVVATVLRGRYVFKDGQPPLAPCGNVLLRRGGAF